ncbi:MAG: SAM-dependent DNA methyltransferase [Planctomycetota bacterium]|nr:SAM-dependent DNA methyltransferase [Planctomycetota bacterium]
MGQLEPASIVEPTCGVGGFLKAALESFPKAHAFGFEINPKYLSAARESLAEYSERLSLESCDFFTEDWSERLKVIPGPILILGNPPWVTNAELTRLGSENRPGRRNQKKTRGIEALTGASNFDISEWIIKHLVDQLKGRDFQLAMLCKSSVARKILASYWAEDRSFSEAFLSLVDAPKYFGAAVDACFFCLSSISQGPKDMTALVCSDFQRTSESRIGYSNGRLIADIETYKKVEELAGLSPLKWRSGLKHDCSKVMEFRRENGQWINGLNDAVDIEDEALYPLLKSSDLMKPTLAKPRRFVIVTQQKIGQETDSLELKWPKTWAYLNRHGEALSARRSSIYKNKPRFSIFGIGDYSFTQWKVAISGFSAKIHFHVVAPYEKKTVMLDDTCYFLPFLSKVEAELACQLLNSQESIDYYSSLIFWNNKRPVTAAILGTLDLVKLAERLGLHESKAFQGMLAANRKPQAPQTP